MNNALARDLADRLHSTSIHLLRHVRAQDDASGLSPARLSALSVVVFGGPLSLGQLAAAEHVTAPTMTRLVAGLEADGLLRRERDEKDKRITWLRATPRGTRVLEEGRRRRVETLARTLAALLPQELATVGEAVGIIERALAGGAEGGRGRQKLSARAR